jgi:hypothetical protein
VDAAIGIMSVDMQMQTRNASPLRPASLVVAASDGPDC